MNEWKHPKTKIGDAVSGDTYLRRPWLNNLFWSYIKKGDVLFVAPRRVGKTSIMKDLVATAPENYFCIYRDVEGASSKNQFYKRLFEMLLTMLGKAAKAKALWNVWAGKYGIKTLGKDSIEIERQPENYQKAVLELLDGIAKKQLKVVLFVDEFVEVILNLKNKEEVNEAIDILHEMREIRHNSQLKDIVFVYAGSIGLHFVVKDIDRPKLINDIEPFPIDPLTKEEAEMLVNQLTKDATVKYNPDLLDCLTGKIGHLLPYYIQLMVNEVNLIAFKDDNKTIDKETIDSAFENVVKNTANFEDWNKRLKDYLGVGYLFANRILCYCAHKDQINIQEIYDLAIKQNMENSYMDLIEELVRDGYLAEQNGTYQFLSPFIKAFWKRRNPIFK